METRAPFIIVGAFVLAAFGAIFGFVYWLHNAGGLGARTTYHVQFEGAVPGLLVGAAVLFDGIRVGEVTGLKIAPDNPRRVNATIAVTSDTPVRADTKVGLEFQGLTGVPAVALEGGKQTAISGDVPVLVAEPGAGQSMTQAARDALRRIDTILAENAEPLQSTISNLKVFSEALSRNTGRLDGILAGLERTMGGAAPVSKAVYDLRVPRNFAAVSKSIKGQLAIPEPTAVVMFETQRILLTPPGKDYAGFADAQWADSIPKMLQEKLIQSFENYDIAHAPFRAMDGINADYQLLIDIRNFQVNMDSDPTAEIAFSARILAKNGHIIASRLFQERKNLDKPEPASAVAAFNSAFESVAKELIGWTVDVL